ncbi:MAG: ATP-binding protein, partial [Myxococcota bacterium]|nr:ATP-binding protein [Myxococcota bacterium]
VKTDISSIHTEMSMAVKHFVVRAARELLFNVVKHADASSVSLTVRQALPELTLMIQDDGTGLSGEDEEGRLVTGLGLPAIRRRTEWLGGQFTISSISGKGTTATLRVPCS